MLATVDCYWCWLRITWMRLVCNSFFFPLESDSLPLSRRCYLKSVTLCSHRQGVGCSGLPFWKWSVYTMIGIFLHGRLNLWGEVQEWRKYLKYEIIKPVVIILSLLTINIFPLTPVVPRASLVADTVLLPKVNSSASFKTLKLSCGTLSPMWLCGYWTDFCISFCWGNKKITYQWLTSVNTWLGSSSFSSETRSWSSPQGSCWSHDGEQEQDRLSPLHTSQIYSVSRVLQSPRQWAPQGLRPPKGPGQVAWKWAETYEQVTWVREELETVVQLFIFCPNAFVLGLH